MVSQMFRLDTDGFVRELRWASSHARLVALLKLPSIHSPDGVSAVPAKVSGEAQQCIARCQLPMLVAQADPATYWILLLEGSLENLADSLLMSETGAFWQLAVCDPQTTPYAPREVLARLEAAVKQMSRQAPTANLLVVDGDRSTEARRWPPPLALKLS